MRLVFRLFYACLLLEMMCLYHCFGHDVKQINYPTRSSIHTNIDQIGPSEFSYLDWVEFLEGKDSDENSEEDTEHNLSSPGLGIIGLTSSIDLPELEQKASRRLLDFKKNKYPLFILFHSWKHHLA